MGDMSIDEPSKVPPTGFAANAARLVEAARANERAVRDLEEATQLLAEGMAELSRCEGLADALGNLSDQIEEAADAADAMRDAADGVGDVAELLDAVAALDEHVVSAQERATALSEGLGRLEARLSEALDHVDAVDPLLLSDQVSALDAKLDRILALLDPQ